MTKVRVLLAALLMSVAAGAALADAIDLSDARDVEVSTLMLLASDPPKQSLHFTLDDVAYRLNVVRADLRDSIAR